MSGTIDTHIPTRFSVRNECRQMLKTAGEPDLRHSEGQCFLLTQLFVALRLS